MLDITASACESYKEDLRTYDDDQYKITYVNYDWRQSLIMYEVMIHELTPYRYLSQPAQDYDAFHVANNEAVIPLADAFADHHRIYLLSNKAEADRYPSSCYLKGVHRLYYLVQ